MILLKIGIKISEKIVHKIMKEEKLLVKVKKIRKYNSYRWEIYLEIPNLLNRNFQADKPNKKWVTNITEFTTPVGKIYLSLIIDYFNGKIVSWKIGEVPDSKLINTIKIISSMSKKVCSPDNSACEKFFERIKNEMFYTKRWTNISFKEFKKY